MPTIAPPVAQPKSYACLVYTPDGETLLGAWPDAPEPRYRLGLDGTGQMSFTLPRPLGRADEAGEPFSLATLVTGNLVEYRVSDADTSSQGAGAGTIGHMLVGVTAVEDDGRGPVVWSGFIVTVDPRPTGPVGVTIVGAQAALDTKQIVGTVTYTGDPLLVAQRLLTDHPAGITWDVRNPVTSTERMTGMALGNESVMSALRKLRDRLGADWLVYVTPQRTLRMFQPVTGAGESADYILSRVADAVIHEDGTDRAKKVLVTYAGGATATATAADYTSAFPHETLITAEQITNATDANRLAALKLAELDRVTYRGEVTIAEGMGQNLEAFEVGQTVSLVLPRPLSTGRTSLVGHMQVGVSAVEGDELVAYEGQPLVIVAVDYQWSTVRLELSRPRPVEGAQYDVLLRKLTEHIAKGAA